MPAAFTSTLATRAVIASCAALSVQKVANTR